MNLRILLIVHALVTFAAGIVLIIAPNLVPNAVNITVPPNAYLVCYLLGAMEIGIAYLSFFAAKLKDLSALKLISLSFIVLHAVTAVVEVYAIAQGVTPVLWGNVALRIGVALLFAYYGVRKLQPTLRS
jgi:hypothetical protein